MYRYPSRTSGSMRLPATASPFPSSVTLYGIDFAGPPRAFLRRLHPSARAALVRHISDYRDIFLPIGRMLQIDRVREVGSDRVVCETDLAENWVFPLHFPGDPIFPGSLLIEGAGQAIAIWAWENDLRGDPRLVRVEAEFRSPVVPEDLMLTYVGTVKRRRNICIGSVEVLARGRKVALIKGTLALTSASAAQAPPAAAQL